MGLRLRVDRRTVGQRVADALRTKILSGELEPGRHINETELAASLGVSRGPIREAFRQLVGEGLLSYQPNRGMSVWQPTQREAWELATLRAGMEGIAIRELVNSRRREWLVETLTPLVEQMELADARVDRKVLAQLDGRFHGIIVAACGNRRIRQLWVGTHPSVWLVALPALFPQYDRPIAPLHRSLVRYMATGTAAEAQEMLIQHILETRGDTIPADVPPIELSDLDPQPESRR